MATYKKFNQLGDKKKEQSPQSSSFVMEIENEEHKASLIGANRVCVIDVYGSWCGPCKVVAPKYEQFAKKFYRAGSCVLLKEDIDKGLSADIQGVPTFLIYKEGQLVETVVGANLDVVEEKVISIFSDGQ